MRFRTRGEEIGIPVIPQDLEGELADAGGAAPDEEGHVRVSRLVGGREGPGEGEAEIGGHGVEDGDEVVGERDGFLGGEVGWDLFLGGCPGLGRW